VPAPSWISGAEILEDANVPPADRPAELAFADLVAAAVNAGVFRRLDRGVFEPELIDGEPEIRLAVLIAARDAYKRREAPFGVTGYADLQGMAIRLARDAIEAAGPVLDRWRRVAIG
jgi:hypothetical protein